MTLQISSKVVRLSNKSWEIVNWYIPVKVRKQDLENYTKFCKHFDFKYQYRLKQYSNSNDWLCDKISTFQVSERKLKNKRNLVFSESQFRA
jgi:hypothetical protein